MSQKSTTLPGLGLIGAAAAAIVGGYFFYGKDGAKHRKHLKTWAVKAKADVLEKLEKAKDISETTYHGIIDEVSKKYETAKKLSPEEIALFSKDLKKHWKDIKKEITPAPAKKTAKKSSK